jgi:molecular chaperone DnaK (HSP70)
MSATTISDDPIGVGIDFGTTNSVVAVHKRKSGTTTVCADIATDLPHPSVVWYRLDERPRIGREAKNHISSYAEVAGNVFVQSVKRNLGSGETFDIFGEKKIGKSRGSRYLSISACRGSQPIWL